MSDTPFSFESDPRTDEEDFSFIQLESPSTPVRLRRVALPLDGPERFQWRIASMLVALFACRGKSATVEQLHILVWAINDPANSAVFDDVWHGRISARRARGYVSGLLQTLSVAQIEGLVEQLANGRQKLTSGGIDFVAEMRRNEVNLGPGDELLTSLSPISTADMSRRLGVQLG